MLCSEFGLEKMLWTKLPMLKKLVQKCLNILKNISMLHILCQNKIWLPFLILGPSMFLPKNFNHQIYQSDLPVLLMVRNFYWSNLLVLFTVRRFDRSFLVHKAISKLEGPKKFPGSPFSVSFSQLPAGKERHQKRCTWKFFWPFLFCDGFGIVFSGPEKYRLIWSVKTCNLRNYRSIWLVKLKI